MLKEYLVKGYTVNEKRLKEQSRQLEELKQTVKLLGNVIGGKALNTEEAEGLLKVITDYTYALDVLDKYDHQVLEIQDITPKELFRITYEESMKAIKGLKDKFGGSSLFGNEKDESFRSSLGAIYQTFGGHDLYPSVWGSCNIEKKRIWVNLELAKKPEHCLEYIIVHEMVHLLERHHNDRFLYYMDIHLPSWRQLKTELNKLPVSHADWSY